MTAGIYCFSQTVLAQDFVPLLLPDMACEANKISLSLET
jgi:hypothetical protein